jgi:hypothetical protein
VLKPSIPLKERLIEQQLSDALRSYLSRVPFLEFASVEHSIRTQRGAQVVAPDVLARVKTGDGTWTLVCECKSVGQPKEVRSAIAQVERYLSMTNVPSQYGVVLAPFISEQSAEICTDAGVGYMDLSGNARLSFDRVFIESRSPENTQKRRRELRSLFFPKSLRILRVMLTGPLRPWKVTELAEAAGVSLGQVSNVRRLLLAQEWAKVRDAGIEVSRPEELLHEWQAQGRRSVNSVQRRRVELFTLDGKAELEAKLARSASALDSRCALTGMAAAARMAPMVRYLRTSAYVDNIAAVTAALGLKPVETGSNVALIEPADEGVFYDLRHIGGVPYVCPVQVYADLTTGGGRFEEAAEALLQEVIVKEWRPATE